MNRNYKLTVLLGDPYSDEEFEKVTTALEDDEITLRRAGNSLVAEREVEGNVDALTHAAGLIDRLADAGLEVESLALTVVRLDG